MIDSIHIKGLKSIADQEFPIAPLTLVTGLNSTGKSTLLQSVLLVARMNSEKGVKYLPDLVTRFDILRNKYIKAPRIEVELDIAGASRPCRLEIEDDKASCAYDTDHPGPEIEKTLYYLSAGRKGPENLAMIYDEMICGLNGEALFGTFEKEKSRPLRESLIKDEESYTLSAQVNHWLRYILALPIEMDTMAVDPLTAKVKYKSDGIPDIMPGELGAGVSYLAKILIVCLRAAEGDLVMIENPEIHLHPAAQSRLGEFLAFVARSGTRLIVETHCENLLNRIRYEVFAGRIPEEMVRIYYKQGIVEPFIPIGISDNGRYTAEFPEGFFDTNLDQLLEMD